MKIHNSIHRPGRKLLAAGAALMMAAAARADYQSTVLSDSPVAFYALNPASDPAGVSPDLTSNGNDGNAINITPAAGPSPYITNAANFNGSAAIDLSQGLNPGLLNFTGPITMEAWAQPNSSSLFGDVVAKGYDSTTYQEIVIRVNGPYGANYYGSSGSTGVNGGVQSTNWTHIVLSSDGVNTTLYENGVKVAQSGDTSGSVMFGDDWMIGNGSSAGNGRLFNGNISEVAIYNHGLTADQVLNHYCMGILNTTAALSKPIISSQPQGQPSYVGGTVTFSVTATSELPTTNLWYKGSTPLTGRTNSTLTLTNLALADAGSYSVVVGNANGTTNSVAAVLTVATPRNLQWSANANTGTWDTGTSANWINLANSQQTVFNAGDAPLFDDTPGVPTTVTVSNTVYPSVVTVNASANTYTISGPGNLGGSGVIVKEGTSTLTLNTPAGFGGSVIVGGGDLYAGNNCFNNASSFVVSNNATLDFGGGQFNSIKPVTVSGSGYNGQGALINSYADYPSELLNVTMAGDTLFAGSARWDLGNGSQISGAHNLTLNWGNGAGYGEWNTVTVGSTVQSITLTNGNFGSKFMDTGFQNPSTVFTVSTNCELSFWNGGWNGSFHIMSGATVDLWTAPAPFSGTTITLDNNAQWRSWGSSGTAEPINSAIVLNGVAHFILGDHDLDYTNLVSGPGGFVLDYWNHSVVFSSANTYTGPTVIGSDGNSPEVSLTGDGSISHSSLIFFGGSTPTVIHLDVTGRLDDTLTLASGQTLAGVGAVNGNLTVSPGATVSPSGTNITLTINTSSTNAVGAIAAAANIVLNGTTLLKLDGSGSNDMVEAGGSITYGGTLNLVNISGAPLAAGNSFQLFNAASYSGSFSSITPTPGTGLAWDTSQLNNGIVSVVSNGGGPVIASTKVSGGSLIFSGTGGTVSGTYYVLTTTNLTKPWIIVATNSYDASGNFNVTNPVTAGTRQQYYRIEQ